MIHKYRRTVHFAETDASGRAHFTSILRYLEEAEHDLLVKLSLPLLDENGGWPRVHISCDYTSSICSGEHLEVSLTIEQIGASSIHWHFQLDSSKNLAAQGKMVTAYVNSSGKAQTIPEKWRKSLVNFQIDTHG